jgi:hypothetical protein
MKGLHDQPVPTHLLFLDHAPGYDLVDRTFNEGGRNQLGAPMASAIGDQCGLVRLELGGQVAEMAP